MGWCLHLQAPREHWRAACGMSDAGRGTSKCSTDMLMLQIKPKRNMFLHCLHSTYCVFWKPKLTGLRQRRRAWVNCHGGAGITGDCNSGALRSQGIAISTSQPLPLKRNLRATASITTPYVSSNTARQSPRIIVHCRTYHLFSFPIPYSCHPPSWRKVVWTALYLLFTVSLSMPLFYKADSSESQQSACIPDLSACQREEMSWRVSRKCWHYLAWKSSKTV